MSSSGIVSLGLKVSASSSVIIPEGMSPEESVKWKFQYYNSLSDSEKLQFLQNPIIPKFTNDEKEYISKYFNENYNDFKDKKTEAAAAAVAISSLAGLAFFIVLSGGTSLIPFAGGTIETAVVETGAAEATAAATAAAEAATGTGIIATLIELLPLALRPIAREIIGRGIQYGYTALNWILESFSVYSLDSLGIGQSLIEVIGPRLPGPLGRAISSVIRNPFYVQQSINYNLLGLTDYFSKPPKAGKIL